MRRVTSKQDVKDSQLEIEEYEDDEEVDADDEEVDAKSIDDMQLKKLQVLTGVVEYRQRMTLNVRGTEHVTFEAGITYPFIMGEEEAAYAKAKEFVDSKILEDVEAVRGLSTKLRRSS